MEITNIASQQRRNQARIQGTLGVRAPGRRGGEEIREREKKGEEMMKRRGKEEK